MDRRQPTFVDWTTDEVLEWLEQLSLSRDYAVAFRGGCGEVEGSVGAGYEWTDGLQYVAS